MDKYHFNIERYLNPFSPLVSDVNKNVTLGIYKWLMDNLYHTLPTISIFILNLIF